MEGSRELATYRSDKAVTTDLERAADAAVERCLDGSVSPAIAIGQILAGSGEVTSVASAVGMFRRHNDGIVDCEQANAARG